MRKMEGTDRQGDSYISHKAMFAGGINSIFQCQ